MAVEGHHDWGCGALNNTVQCSCEPRDDCKTIPPMQTTTEVARKPTMAEALRIHDQITKKLKP